MLPLAEPASGGVRPRPRWLCAFLLLASWFWLSPGITVTSAPPRNDAGPRPLFDRKVAAAVAAAQVAAVRDPFTALALRTGGVHNLVWSEYEVERVPVLDERLLESVEDKKPMPDFRGKAPDEIPRREAEEYAIFSKALLNARDTAPDLFAREAGSDDNRALTWGHLFREPARFRGKVVHMAGRLKRIERQDAPWPAVRQGMEYVYEGWVFVDRPNTNPVCVLFAHMPEGLHVAESMDQHVSFNGYFFKKYLYHSGKGDRYTLLFIAPTLNVVGPAGTAAATVSGGVPNYVYYVIAAVIVGTIVLLVGLTVWFRHSDRQLRRRLAAARAARATDLGFASDEVFIPEIAPEAEHDGNAPKPNGEPGA
jgi:hypothetical protein